MIIFNEKPNLLIDHVQLTQFFIFPAKYIENQLSLFLFQIKVADKILKTRYYSKQIKLTLCED